MMTPAAGTTAPTCSSNVICAQLYSACSQNSACIGIDQCFDGCGTDADFADALEPQILAGRRSSI